MKVMVAYPPLKGKGSPMLTQNRQFQWYNEASFIYPVIPASAATLLKENGFDTYWTDYITEQKSYEEFLATLKVISPDLIAMETKTPVVRQHWKIVDEIKELLPGIKTVIMGDHVTAFPEETMLGCKTDYVITGGDYDFMLLNIARVLSGEQERLEPGIWYRKDAQVRNTGLFELNHDLNTLPFIDRTLTNAGLYGEKWRKRDPFYYTMVGRDCPWNKCTFCSWTTTFPKFRTRTVERHLDEIGFLIEEHGVREIFDDSGTIPGGGWLKQFCEGMIDRGYNKKILFSCNMRFDYLKNIEVPQLMKRAGFRKIKSGLESANQKTLDKIKKGISVENIIKGCQNASKAGIDVHLTVMVGYPWETREDAQRTLDLAKWLMKSGYAEMLQATVVVPYPGTPLYDYVKERGEFICPPDDYEKFDMRGSVVKTPDMSPDEIVEMCNGVYRSFLTPRYVARQLIKNAGDINYIMRGAKAVIGHLRDFKK